MERHDQLPAGPHQHPATTAANMAVVVAIKIHHATGSPLIRTFCGRTRKNSPAVATLSRPMTSAVCVRRCTATVNMAIVAATAVATEKIDSSAVSTATPTGNGGATTAPHTRSPRTHRRQPTRTAMGPAGQWPSRRRSGAHDGRQHHTDHVDGPVPTAAADVPPRLVVSPVEFEQGRRYQAGMVRACGRPVDGNRAGHAISLSSPAGAGNRPSAVFAAPARRRKAPSASTKGGSARLAEPSNGGPDDVLWPMRQGCRATTLAA